MIDPLDSILRDLVQSRIVSLNGPTQVGFAPPNADWKAAVAAAAEPRVNFYLYDMREDLKLRTNERDRTQHPDGRVTENLASPRLDCTYLVTAWSPVAFTPLLDPTREEHDLLYTVLAVLMRFRPLVAAEVYSVPNPLGHTLAGVRPKLREQPLPASVALPDAVKEPTEFWTTMKVDWRPAIHLTVTVPVVLDEPEIESPFVTTLTGVYAQAGVALATETAITIGGRVLRGANATPVADAWVQIAGVKPPEVVGIRQRLFTGADGRFVFSPLPRGTYQVRAVQALDDVARTVEVPSLDGNYDVQFP